MVVVVVVCLFVDRTICSVRVGVCEDESFLVFPYPPSVVRRVPGDGKQGCPSPGRTSTRRRDTQAVYPARFLLLAVSLLRALSPGPVSPYWFLVSPCHPAACYKRSEVALVTHALDILS